MILNGIQGETKTRLYEIWRGVIRRTTVTSSKSYKSYGGRGIVMCDEWLADFQTFKRWALNNNYSEELTLDRINVNGNYEPNNCRFTTWAEQANNRSNNVHLSLDGVTKSAAEWAKETGLRYNTIISRLLNGWSESETLRTPTGRRIHQPIEPRSWKKDHINSDAIGAGNLIKSRCAALGIKMKDLCAEVNKKGERIAQSNFSKAINGKLDRPQADRVREIAQQILDEKERR